MAESQRTMLDRVVRERTALKPRMKALSDKGDLSRSEMAELDQLLDTFENLTSSERSLRARLGVGGDDGHVEGASRGELRDRALRVLENEGHHLAPHQIDHVDKLLRSRNGDVDGAVIAKRILLSENDAYRSAFMKGVTESSPIFSAQEQAAVAEFRAANEGTGSAGGFGIPVLIDPTIILTSGAADAPLLQISRVVTITTDAWKGVSSSGVVWSYDAEASAVSDDTPTFAQPQIPVYMARGFIPYSIEVGQDYPGFADEMSMLLNQGFIDLVAKQSMTGSGTASPTGIFTALTNVTTNPAHVVVTTTGALGAVDIRAAWSSLPERYRPRATWVMSPSVLSKVSQFGNGLAISDYTVNLLQDGSSVIAGRPVVISDYAPAFTGTSGSENFCCLGDFSRYVFVSRAGMSVELIPTIFDQATARPTGNRAWFSFARHGMGVSDPNGFRLLSNT